MMKRLMFILALLFLAIPAMAQQQVPISGGVATIDVTGGNYFKLILNQNVTSLSFTPIPAPPKQITILFTQDATGGRTVAFATGITSTCSVSSAANSSSICQFVYDSSSATWNSLGGSLSLPTTLTAPGVFTSTQFNTNFDLTLTGGGTCNENTITNLGGSTFKLTNMFSGCVNLPTSGVTNAFTNVFGAYGINPNANSAGQFGNIGLVGYYSQIWCRGGSAANTKCWGANFSVSDDTSAPANLFGSEYDVTVNNTTTTGFGTLYSFRGNGQPTLHSFPVIDVGAPAGTGTFTDGFKTENNSISTVSGFAAINIGTQINTNPSNSQFAYFNARNASGTALSCGLGLLGSSVGDTTDGTWGFGLCPLQVTQIASAGTQSLSGCSLTSAVGGISAGSFHSGTAGACTVTITMQTASHGFACDAHDLTTVADIINQTATTTTTATISGTTASGDVITWKCVAF